MSRQKKALVVSHLANFQKFNGPLVLLLGEMGYEVHYVSAGDEKVKDVDRHFEVNFSRSPVRIDRHLKALRQLKKILDNTRYDIVHVHTPIASAITRVAAKETRRDKGTRIIYTAHGFHFLKGGPKIGWLLWFPIEWLLARYTDTIVTINKEDYDRARRFFSTDIKWLKGGVGVDKSKFAKKITKEERNRIRKKLGIKEGDFVIIYLAELHERKNQEMLIRATPGVLEKIPNAKVLLVGFGKLTKQYKKLVKKLGLEEQVIFLGYRQDVPDLLAISDMAVSTSKREGLAIGILQAVAAGLPVVVTDVRGHVAGLEKVCVGDIAGLVGKIVSTRDGKIKPIKFSDDYGIAQAIEFHRDLYKEQ